MRWLRRLRLLLLHVRLVVVIIDVVRVLLVVRLRLRRLFRLLLQPVRVVQRQTGWTLHVERFWRRWRLVWRVTWRVVARSLLLRRGRLSLEERALRGVGGVGVGVAFIDECDDVR